MERTLFVRNTILNVALCLIWVAVSFLTVANQQLLSAILFQMNYQYFRLANKAKKWSGRVTEFALTTA